MILLIEYENKSREICDKYIFDIHNTLSHNDKGNDKNNVHKKW